MRDRTTPTWRLVVEDENCIWAGTIRSSIGCNEIDVPLPFAVARLVKEAEVVLGFLAVWLELKKSRTERFVFRFLSCQRFCINARRGRVVGSKAVSLQTCNSTGALLAASVAFVAALLKASLLLSLALPPLP